MTAHQFLGSAMVALFVASMFGCQREAVVARIGEQVRRGPGHQLVLSDAAPFDWDRVCVFGPYTPAAKLVETTGVSEAGRAGQGIERNDGISLLLFLERDRVVEEVELPRAEGDFAPELLDKCYSRRDAMFAVRVIPPNSSGNIGPGAR